MLFSGTLIVDYLGMSTSLWLAFYLLARGFPHRLTMRAVIVLLSLALFFLGAYQNLFQPLRGMAAWRAVMLILGFCAWYSVTYELLPAQRQSRSRLFALALYTWGMISGAMLVFTPGTFLGEETNALWVAKMGVGVPYLSYGLFQMAITVAMLYNFLADHGRGLRREGRYFFMASLFPFLGVGYGVLGLISSSPLPRLIQDLLAWSGVLMFGISVAYHQTLVQRRTTLEDFPVSGLAVVVLSGIYGILAWWAGATVQAIGTIVLLAVLTHSLYDLVREFLERLRYAQESAFRRQLRQIGNLTQDKAALLSYLQEGLEVFCRTLNATGGFIAILEQERYLVSASIRSLKIGTALATTDVAGEDIHPGDSLKMDKVAWLAPAFEGDSQVAVVGLCQAKTNVSYTPDDLDLLAEFADKISTVLALHNAQPTQTSRLMLAAAQIETSQSELQTRTAEMMGTATRKLAPEFVKLVEEALRNLGDQITLGQSPLAQKLGIQQNTQLETGKALQEVITQAIEVLHPAGPRPPEPLPQTWYNYVILHDAYVECVPNREIMARLYISEGTFNRTRRTALRGIARYLLETAR